jgi:putative transposase
MMEVAVQAVLEVAMTEALSAVKSARVDGRQGYCSGYTGHSLVPGSARWSCEFRANLWGRFWTALVERDQRSEKALVSALAEMYVQGASTRKVKEVTETLCGHSFSATSISEMNRTLDAALTAFATRRLDEPYPCLILDARYERAREGGIIASQAVLIAVAVTRLVDGTSPCPNEEVDSEGRRQILGVELANRESVSSCGTSCWG